MHAPQHPGPALDSSNSMVMPNTRTLSKQLPYSSSLLIRELLSCALVQHDHLDPAGCPHTIGRIWGGRALRARSGTCSASGSDSGYAPRPISVCATGMPVRATNSRSSAAQSRQPPPTYSTGRRAPCTASSIGLMSCAARARRASSAKERAMTRAAGRVARVRIQLEQRACNPQEQRGRTSSRRTEKRQQGMCTSKFCCVNHLKGRW